MKDAMKKYMDYIVLCCVFLFTACTENKMYEYTEAPAINFMTLDKNGDYSNEESLLKRDFNFTEKLSVKETVTDVYAQLQGKIQDHPLKVSLKVEQVDTFPLAEVHIAEQYLIFPGNYIDTLVFEVMKPQTSARVYKAKICFDYEQSEVQAGNIEQQEFQVTVWDNYVFSWDAMGITSESWDAVFKPYIGNWSIIKIRFMLDAAEDTDLLWLASMMADADDREYIIQALKEELISYEEKNGTLVDEYGKPVVFEP